MNTQKEILSFSEYIKYIEENYSRNSLFRGLKDKSFALIPKIGNALRLPTVSCSPCRALERGWQRYAAGRGR